MTKSIKQLQELLEAAECHLEACEQGHHLYGHNNAWFDAEIVKTNKRINKLKKKITRMTTMPSHVYQVVCGVYGPQLRKYSVSRKFDCIILSSEHDKKQFLPLCPNDEFPSEVAKIGLYPTKKAAVKAFEKGYRTDIKAAWALIKKPAN